MATSTLPLAELLDSLLQKSYHELTVLAELLPRKSDVDRKIGIVSFASQTRLQLVRLLALVKWAGSSNSVQKCSEMSQLLSQQSWMYEDTANQLVTLARHQLLLACMPNFSLAPALDVLCSGSYPRLPSCIRDNIIPPSPLTGAEADSALSLLTFAIRRRLLSENIPSQMTVNTIGKGVVVFEVPHEFRLALSVVGDDQQLPWRLVNLEVLVGAGLRGSPPLCHTHQTRYLTQLAQSHLVTADPPLSNTFTLLHTFCLSLLLDCLHTQGNQMNSGLCGNYVRIEEYQPGHHLGVGYWYPMTTTSSTNADTGGTTPHLVITVDPSSPSHPITTTHSPPLPGDHQVEVDVGRVCLEEVIDECVRLRATAKLQILQDSLQNTIWQDRAVLCTDPLCLRVSVGKSGGSVVVISVDVRMGTVIADVEPCAVGEGVERELGEMEKEIALDATLSVHLTKIQCQLVCDRILTCGTELGLSVCPSLPLPTPLPLPSPHTLYIQLLPLAYLAVCACEEDGEVITRCFLVKVAEGRVGGEGGGEQLSAVPSMPRIFPGIMCVAELDHSQLIGDSLRCIPVRASPAVLKRKLQEGEHGLPSTKRVCVVGSQAGFSPLPSLCSSHLLLTQIRTSLKMSGIRGYQELWAGHGCPCVSVCEFPLLPGQSSDVHCHLSSLLISCLLFPSPAGHKLVMVFSPLIPASQAPDIVLHHHLPPDTEVGTALLALWKTKLTLLSMALELQHYVEDPLWPLSSSCLLSHFGYDSLTVSYGEHSLSLHGGLTGLQLTFSPESPHVFLEAPLQQCLLATLSLPTLLQGIVGTEETTSLLQRFTASFTGASLVSLSAVQVQLHYHSLSLSMNILAGGQLEFTNLQFGHQRLPMSMPGIPSPLGYLKAFIHGILGVEGAVTELEDVATPLSRPLAGRLQPPPMPISSPSRPLLPSSPLPSIPALPTPPSLPHSLPSLSPWSYLTSADQLRSLLLAPPTATPTPPLMIFMASLSQLCQFWQQAAIDRAQPPPTTGQLQYVSTERRVYHYRTETLTVSLSMDTSQLPTLQLLLTPARDGCWSTQELQLLTDFWKKEVASPPFSLQAVVSYVKLLQLPLLTLKSCVQLMAYHLTPPTNLPWMVSLCMVVPPGAEDEIPAQLKPGTPGIIYKGKLLLMIQLTHTQDGRKGLVPLMHDLRTNTTFAARNPHQTCMIKNLDAILKKVSQEHVRPNQESSIFPCVKALLTLSIPSSSH